MAIFKRVICIVVGLALLTACGYTGSGRSADTVPNLRDYSKEISFSWWGNDVRHEYTNAAIDIFEEQNPGVRVKTRYGVWEGYDKRNQVWMQARTESDVMQINFPWISRFSVNGEGYYDLNELTDYIDLSGFTEEELKYSTVNKKLNALPIAFNTPQLYYTKETWEKYGLEQPTTWDDFYKAAEVMSQDGVYPLGMVKKMVFMMLLARHEQETGQPSFAPNGNLLLSVQDLSDMIELYWDMIDKKVLAPPDSVRREDFYEGKIACVISWASDAGKYCNGAKQNGLTPVIGGQLVPEDAKLYGWYIKPATLIAISKYTAYPEESAKLVDFLINSPDMARLQGSEKGIPVSRKALDALKDEEGAIDEYDRQANDFMRQNMEKMSVIKPAMESDDVVSAFKSYCDDYRYGADTLQNCAAKFRNDIVAAVDDSRL